MDETLTMHEIEERFDDEWILVEDPILDERNEVIAGRVLFHSKNRDDVYRKALELRPKRSAFLFTGPTPDNIWVNA